MNYDFHPFDDPRECDSDCIAVGGDFSFHLLLKAYENRIYPWPNEMEEYAWFSPKERGVLFFNEAIISRSNKRLIKKPWVVTENIAFDEVIQQCQLKHDSTWITEELRMGFNALFHRGYAYSIEVWNLDAQLIGGLFGVTIPGKQLTAESMFFKESGASKRALIHLIETHQKRETPWVDLQMVTPITERFGARLISQHEFYQLKL